MSEHEPDLLLEPDGGEPSATESPLESASGSALTYERSVVVRGATYRVRAHTCAGAAGPALAVDLVGAAPTGEVITEVTARVPIAALNDVARLVDQLLSGVAMLDAVGSPGPDRARSDRGSKAGPPNNGQPWTSEANSTLAELWLANQESADVREALREAGAELGRSVGSIRSQLPRIGLDPDVPGRALSTAAAETLGPRAVG